MWIGVDDTDGPDGGCTTFVLTELLALARRSGLDLLGWPRLVRLNPNVPWKTRGNGALAAHLGHGKGPPRTVGEIDGLPVRSFTRGTAPTSEESLRFLSEGWALVDRLSAKAPRTDPVLVSSSRRPDPSLYRDAVSEVVPISRARAALLAAGGSSWHRRSARGLIGATAALAWPARKRTFELLAYRRPGRVGQPRRIDRRSLARAVQRHPALFLCEDPRTRRMLIAPHTSCPILFGLRAPDPRTPVAALADLSSETVDRWLLFATNQATGDHLRLRSGRNWPLRAAGRTRGRVEGPPMTGPGGHVRFPLRTEDGATIACVTFEPTKTLPKVAASLLPGDLVEVAGGRGEDGSVRVERLTLRTLVPRRGPRRAPTCPGCQRTAESLGTQRGYRCRGCHLRFPPESARSPTLPRAFGVGTYHPTPSARRHLHPRVP
jgi:tRNA(Ile2)-agmatinylcytidine synthase